MSRATETVATNKLWARSPRRASSEFFEGEDSSHDSDAVEDEDE